MVSKFFTLKFWFWLNVIKAICFSSCWLLWKTSIAFIKNEEKEFERHESLEACAGGGILRKYDHELEARCYINEWVLWGVHKKISRTTTARTWIYPLAAAMNEVLPSLTLLVTNLNTHFLSLIIGGEVKWTLDDRLELIRVLKKW